MRPAIRSFVLLTILHVAGQLHGQEVRKAHRTEIEFYIAGRLQPPPKYRVRSFRRIGTTGVELARDFHGLVAQDLEQGEYEYALEPEITPAGPPGSFTLTGKVQLYGSFPHWITLQMPTGVIADVDLNWINGRVLMASVTRQGSLWIRSQHAVDHSQFFQMKLDNDGAFRIPDPAFDGSVVVTVCRGSDVVFVDVVHFTAGRPDRPLEFRLKSNVVR